MPRPTWQSARMAAPLTGTFEVPFGDRSADSCCHAVSGDAFSVSFAFPALRGLAGGPDGSGHSALIGHLAGQAAAAGDGGIFRHRWRGCRRREHG